eukprot:SAG22_NODE_3835_length_1510_cov_2.924167_2_plen_120_part_00
MPCNLSSIAVQLYGYVSHGHGHSSFLLRSIGTRTQLHQRVLIYNKFSTQLVYSVVSKVRTSIFKIFKIENRVQVRMGVWDTVGASERWWGHDGDGGTDGGAENANRGDNALGLFKNMVH